MPDLLLIVYCVLIVAASLLGGLLPFLLTLTHRRMQLLMSFVGGLMLGVALLHLIPHALAEASSIDHVAYSVVAGVLLTFFMIRFFHVHQHGHEVGDGHEHHEDTCDHGTHEHAHGNDHTHTHHLSWSGLFFGLALHTFFDGLALGASVAAGSHDKAAVFVGLGTFLAIVLHKPLDSLSLTCVMSGGRWTRKSISLVNLAFASMCPLGAVVFYFGLGGYANAQPEILSCALGFAGGIFLCISLADILPELQFHQHDRGLLSVALLFGVLLAYLIGFAESGHGHSEGHQHDAAKTSTHQSEPEHSHSEHEHSH